MYIYAASAVGVKLSITYLLTFEQFVVQINSFAAQSYTEKNIRRFAQWTITSNYFVEFLYSKHYRTVTSWQSNNIAKLSSGHMY